MNHRTVWIWFAAVFVVAGCGSSIGIRGPDFRPSTTGKLFLAPPRDMTHGAELVGGSGAEFQSYLRNWLARCAPSLEVVTSTSGNLSHTEFADQGVVLEEAAAVGADSALRIRLGDMRDAAAMTFRTDYVTLDRGELLRVSDSKLLWSVSSHMIQGSNVGNWHGHLNTLAKIVAVNITQN